MVDSPVIPPSSNARSPSLSHGSPRARTNFAAAYAPPTSPKRLAYGEKPQNLPPSGGTRTNSYGVPASYASSYTPTSGSSYAASGSSYAPPTGYQQTSYSSAGGRSSFNNEGAYGSAGGRSSFNNEGAYGSAGGRSSFNNEGEHGVQSHRGTNHSNNYSSTGVLGGQHVPLQGSNYGRESGPTSHSGIASMYSAGGAGSYNGNSSSGWHVHVRHHP